MMDAIIQVSAALIGTLAFGLIFNIRGKKLLVGALGGMLAWALFLLLGLWIPSEVARYFLVSVAIAGYAEIFARVLKTPTTTFVMVSLISLIPGSGLYYTVASALNGDLPQFLEKALHTLALAAALSLGIVVVSALVKHATAYRNKRKEQ
ncbi:MAG: threonine/serine exporter family protein [Clostridia bacterium]|nr:threonine/serine exporter family protein [Clostridia bacterium]